MVALLLAIVGVFGVFSYLVEERRYEIGIRLALGASPAEIGAALFRGAGERSRAGWSRLTLSAITGMSLRRFLFGLSPADPMSYLMVSLSCWVTAAIIATAIPIARALRVDPAVTLKAE